MRPITALRRAPAFAAIAVLTSCIVGAAAAAGTDPGPPAETATAGTDPGPPAETATGSSDAVDDSAASDTSVTGGSFDIPGGVEPEVLQEGTWFDDQGRLWRPEASSVADEKHAAFCDFLFGTPDEIADAFGIDSLELAEGSGFKVLGSSGTGFQCGYNPSDGGATAATDGAGETSTSETTVDSGSATDADTASGSGSGSGPGSDPDSAPDTDSDPDTDSEPATDEEPMIAFILWSKPLEIDDDDADDFAELIVLDGGEIEQSPTFETEHSAALAITTAFDGEMIDADFADAWLTTARDRLA